ncbi:MAG TPA: FAD-dependent oxidoreductase [Candidatus Melainabacteria bacterium]|nr:FAD-dependent oxidoreductase [Candidatus Melainabacteria bacterium]
MNKLAIIGGGIAGLGLAYRLRNSFDLVLYEKDNRAGGHSHTVDIEEADRTIPVDTGFMVFNQVTYPHLLQLFKELDVPMKKTDMSFSVQLKGDNLEYSGASFDRLFGDRKNILSLRFWKFLLEIDRFNKDGLKTEEGLFWSELSLQDYAPARNYSKDLVNRYLIPMTGALWSAPPEKMMEFPAITLLRFFRNHGLLATETHHQWWTVDGGARVYVDKILGQLGTATKIGCGAIEVTRDSKAVRVKDADGEEREFDQVVFACHADQALNLLKNPREEERDILSAFSYQRNDTTVHTDSFVMPHHKRCWASWNYRLANDGSSTHYWMNSLQNVSDRENYFVSLNADHMIDQKKVLRRMVYHHPLFDLPALEAQKKLPELNRNSYKDQIFYCGSYFGFGFHEDALRSSIHLAELLTGSRVCS